MRRESFDTGDHGANHGGPCVGSLVEGLAGAEEVEVRLVSLLLRVVGRERGDRFFLALHGGVEITGLGEGGGEDADGAGGAPVLEFAAARGGFDGAFAVAEVGIGRRGPDPARLV